MARRGRPVEAVVPLLRTRTRLHARVALSVPCLTLLGAGAGAADHLGFPALPHRRDHVGRWLLEQAGSATLWLPNLDASSASLLPPAALEHSRRLRPV